MATKIQCEKVNGEHEFVLTMFVEQEDENFQPDICVRTTGGDVAKIGYINIDGILRLYAAIPDNIGLKVDAKGFIKVVR